MSLRLLLEEARESRRLLEETKQGRTGRWLMSVGVGAFVLLILVCTTLFEVGVRAFLPARLGDDLAQVAWAARWLFFGFLGFGLLTDWGEAYAYYPTKMALNLTSFEALRMPSRRGSLLARVLQYLPELIVGGVVLVICCWAFWGVDFLMDGWVRPSRRDNSSTSALDMVLLTPWLLLLPGAAGGLVLVRLLMLQPRWRLLPLFFLPLLPFATVVLFAYHHPYSRTAAGWPLLLYSGLALVAISAVYPALVLAVEHIEPWAQIRPGAGRGTLFRVVRARRAAVGGPAALVRPLSWLRGRYGLFWATLSLDLFRGVLLFWHLVLSVLLLLAMFVPWADRSTGEFVVARGALFVPAWFLLFLLGPLLRLNWPRQVYLLGVDYRALLLFNLATWWVSLALLVALLTALATGADPDRLALVAAVGGSLLLRAGWIDPPAPLFLQVGPWLKRLYQQCERLYQALPRAAQWGMLLLALLVLALVSWETGGLILSVQRSIPRLESGWGYSVVKAILQGLLANLWWIAGTTAGMGAAGMAYRLWAYDELTLREQISTHSPRCDPDLYSKVV
jgi:hypothetical protein